MVNRIHFKITSHLAQVTIRQPRQSHLSCTLIALDARGPRAHTLGHSPRLSSRPIRVRLTVSLDDDLPHLPFSIGDTKQKLETGKEWE